MTDSPMSPHERAMALQRVNADLLWLILDDNWTRARTVLGNSEIQSELRAQRYDHIGGRSSGDIDYADPTGEAVARTASDEVRAGVIERVWYDELTIVTEFVTFIAETVETITGIERPAPRFGLGTRSHIATCSELVLWMLDGPPPPPELPLGIPHAAPVPLLSTALDGCDHEQQAEVDASIRGAAEHAQALRSGKLYHHTPDGVQVAIPSVHSVLHSARKVLAQKATEPAPKQKAVGCRNHARFGQHADLSADSASWCDQCRNFRRREGVMPTEAIVRHWEIHPTYPPPGLILEAKAKGKRRKAS